jgi:hypothetical protein
VRTALLGASLGGLAIAGSVTGARAATAAEEACAFAMKLRSVYTVERVLREFPSDRCVPLMLSALSPSLLSQITPALVLGLPDFQLKMVPKEVMDQIGTAAPDQRRRDFAPRYEPQY